MSRTQVAIAFGSNLGDREAHLAFAAARLADVLSNVRLSSSYETTPVDVSGEQPLFLNRAAVGETAATPLQLLETLLAIERQAGRIRSFPKAPRTLDLDLLLFGSEVIQERRLIVPHPRFRERLFVLEPLAEIAPDMRDPVTSLTVGQLLARLRPEQPAPDR